jgi:hypothetical protein
MPACIAILALCSSLWAADPVRFAEAIAMPDVSGVSLPVALPVESSAAQLVAAPQNGAAPVQRLRLGDHLTVLQFLTGPQRVRDCKAVPFDGCVSRTSVWVRARTDAGKTGYCSLSDLRTPLPGRGLVQKPQNLFLFADALTSTQSKTFTIRARYLPETGPSFLDRVGWQNVMAKILAPTGELVASRRELEFLVRQSGGSFSYSASAPPAGMQPMTLDPPLTALALYDDRAGWLAISIAAAADYANVDSQDHSDAAPRRYRLPPGAKNAGGVVLLTTSAAGQMRKERVKVSTRLYSYKVTSTVVSIRVTAVDLDGDGHPDIVRYQMSETIPDCNPRTDECGAQAAAMLVLLDGAWYVTGGTWATQEGPAAY